MALVAALKAHRARRRPGRSPRTRRSASPRRCGCSARRRRAWSGSRTRARYRQQPPLQHTFNLMTRSQAHHLGQPAAAGPRAGEARSTSRSRRTHGAKRNSDGSAPPPLFAPLQLRGLTLREPRRGVADVPVLGEGRRARRLAPGAPGQPRDGRRRAGDDRDDRRLARGPHHPRLRRAVERRAGRRRGSGWWTSCTAHSASKMGMQLAHAGPQGVSCQRPWEGDGPLRGPDEAPWQTLGPSALPFDAGLAHAQGRWTRRTSSG